MPGFDSTVGGIRVRGTIDREGLVRRLRPPELGVRNNGRPMRPEKSRPHRHSAFCKEQRLFVATFADQDVRKAGRRIPNFVPEVMPMKLSRQPVQACVAALCALAAGGGDAACPFRNGASGVGDRNDQRDWTRQKDSLKMYYCAALAHELFHER